MLSIKFFLLCIYIAYCSFVILQYKYIVKYFLERSEKMDLFAARFKKLKMERNVTYQLSLIHIWSGGLTQRMDIFLKTAHPQFPAKSEAFPDRCRGNCPA